MSVPGSLFASYTLCPFLFPTLISGVSWSFDGHQQVYNNHTGCSEFLIIGWKKIVDKSDSRINFLTQLLKLCYFPNSLLASKALDFGLLRMCHQLPWVLPEGFPRVLQKCWLSVVEVSLTARFKHRFCVWPKGFRLALRGRQTFRIWHK